MCMYRCRLCCVRELKFEPRDSLHHIRAAGHHVTGGTSSFFPSFSFNSQKVWAVFCCYSHGTKKEQDHKEK
ncbi:unnamed protein product [Pleuronectes platessa]|uniref:Uncharacterized protein n=1 Tax=Pleuronectes platessa TaxID=8262 RepID=A0A9N7W0Y7_PLEPL|nr:unnamed protein product [Pleuronectes platessa]